MYFVASDPTRGDTGRLLVCKVAKEVRPVLQFWLPVCQGENGIIFGLNMSGEMHMRRRNEVFGCIPHGRGASGKWQKRSDLFCTYCDM